MFSQTRFGQGAGTLTEGFDNSSTSRSGRSTGSARSSRLFTIENIAAVAPMPSASVRIVTAVKPGDIRKVRIAWRTSGIWRILQPARTGAPPVRGKKDVPSPSRGQHTTQPSSGLMQADGRHTEGRCLVSTLDNLRREAKRWLRAIRAGDVAAIRRLHRAHPGASSLPVL